MLIRTIVFYISRVALLIILLALIIATLFYLQCPVYKFKEGKPFSGNAIFNPYQSLDSLQWKKANFHTHTTASDGKNTLSEVQRGFNRYGYQILAISDHSVVTPQKLNPAYEIPAYEHGINLSKFHAVIIGARRGSIFDYVLFNTPSQKYDAFRRHHMRGDIVVLDHPDRTRWLNPEDFRYISWYHFLEVQKGSAIGELPYYDTALSNGHYASAMASDDCHNVEDNRRFARAATYVYTPTARYADVRDALLRGRTFALNIPPFADDPLYKLKRHHHLPQIRSLVVANDTVTVHLSETATIRAFGQAGKLRGEVGDTNRASFPFTTSDTYLRFVAEFPDGVMLFTNPLVRYDGNTILFENLAQISYPLTVAYMATCLLLLVIWIWLFIRVSKSIFRFAKTSRVSLSAEITPNENA